MSSICKALKPTPRIRGKEGWKGGRNKDKEGQDGEAGEIVEKLGAQGVRSSE